MSNDLSILGIENSHLFQSTLFQALETSYLIESSNAPDTVVGRCQLLKSIFEMISIFRESPRFNEELQESLDNHKQIYYDKILSEKQIYIVTKADWKYLITFFFDNMMRSFYSHIDKQFTEIQALKKQSAKSKRIDSLHDLVVSQNIAILKLVLYKTDKETLDNTFIKAGNLQKDLYNYIKLKQDGFNEWILTEFNGESYEDENAAPISETAKKMVKEIKSKLYVLQFELRNQEYRITLKVIGVNNVGLAIDENSDKELVQKITSLFK